MINRNKAAGSDMIVMEMLLAADDFGIYGGRVIEFIKSIFIAISKKQAANFIGNVTY